MWQSCEPYPFPSCCHYESCPLQMCGNNYNAPPCTERCQSNYTTPYVSDLHFGKSAYSVKNSVTAIQTEIMTDGPVESTIQVYQDFLTYRSGVYRHTNGTILGEHSVKILGWGVSSGTNYWIVANSWNPYWGNNGYFWILSGVNECAIEQNIVAGLAKWFQSN